jgi:cardiolipin synthase
MNIQLLTQPGAGIQPLLNAIDQAEKTIQIVIFRFDRSEIEAALKRAVRRGVFVHALVAYTNSGQGGERTLRGLEMRLLADGISVARTSNDLARYHNKLLIIDESLLFMLGFNFTYLDIDRSRCFGIATRHKPWVEEAVKLFHADTTRQPYAPEVDTFVVSPINARRQLKQFLEAAQRQLLIYDGKLTDPEMMAILSRKAREGVEIRILGAIGKRASGVLVAPMPVLRLHAQAILRDKEAFFLGSQSLRTLELDARREVGLLVDDPEAVRSMLQTFEYDWSHVTNSKLQGSKIMALPALLSRDAVTLLSSHEELNTLPSPPPMETVKEAVKEAIKDVILEVLHEPSETKLLKSLVKEAAREAVQEATELVLIS